jgi:hypothetical protein
MKEWKRKRYLGPSAEQALRNIVQNLELYRCYRCGNYGKQGHLCPECGWDQEDNEKLRAEIAARIAKKKRKKK